MKPGFFSLYRFFLVTALFLVAVGMAACSEVELASTWVKKFNWPGQQEQGGTYKIGAPYRVGSVWYYPHEDFNYAETGIASWYGPDFNGHRTANGEVYDQTELTGAHRTLQMPALVRVTNLENGRSVVVRINDRGPYLHGRILDVSKRAAELLGFIGRGTARVRLETLPRESREIAEAAKRGMDTSRLSMADLARYDTGQLGTAGQSQPVRVAENGNNTPMPESLQTPTITVEQLSAPAGGPGTHTSAPPPDWKNSTAQQGNYEVSPGGVTPEQRHDFVNHLDLSAANPNRPAGAGYQPPERGSMVKGHLNDEGHFMPAPVVSHEPVVPTGLFVQAGAFAVRENAERLRETLGHLAPVIIEPVDVKGRTLYRVKLGPISSVAKADEVLDKVIAAGNNTARVVHNK